jgi:hypothetical protein
MRIFRHLFGSAETLKRILAGHESKVQSPSVRWKCDAVDGSIPRIRVVLLPAVSRRSLAFMVYRYHRGLVHHEFPALDVTGQENIQGAGCGTAEGTSHLHNRANCCFVPSDRVIFVFSLWRERNDERRCAPRSCDSGGCISIVLHWIVWVESISCETRKGLKSGS